MLWSRFSALAIAAASPLAFAQAGPGELRDLAPPVEMPEDPVWHLYLAGAIVVLLIVAGMMFIVRRRRPQPEVRPVPPHRTALEALRELEDSPLDPRDFYIRLTDILRGYIAGRFGIDEPDATTAELLGQLFRLAEIAPERQRVLRILIGEADLVKFAGRVPAPGAGIRAVRDCRDFVEETAAEEAQLAL